MLPQVKFRSIQKVQSRWKGNCSTKCMSTLTDVTLQKAQDDKG